MQLLESSRACLVKTLRVWSTWKRNIHTPKVTPSTCSVGSPELTCFPGWSLGILPLVCCWEFRRMSSCCYVSLRKRILETLAHCLSAMCWPWWWISSLSFCLLISFICFFFLFTSLSVLLPHQACKESKAGGCVYYPSASWRIIPAFRLSNFTRFCRQLRKQEHEGIVACASQEGQAAWTRDRLPIHVWHTLRGCLISL